MSGHQPPTEAQQIGWLARRLTEPTEPLPGASARSLAALAHVHGVAPLLSEALAGENAPDPSLRQALLALQRAGAVFSVTQDLAAALAVQALEEAALEPVVFKGLAMALVHYRRPELRPRADTDVLVAPAALGEAVACLERAGFAPLPGLPTGVVSRQVTLSRRHDNGLHANIDVHGAISNRPRLARAMDHAYLAARAQRCQLGAVGLRVPGDEDALALAAIHLEGHHRHERRLIWLYDMVLLLAALDDGGLHRAVERARACGYLDVLAPALHDAARVFEAAVARATRERLEGLAAQVPAPAPGRWHAAATDWRALSGVAERGAFLREHLFPPRGYMRSQFGAGWLPLLYVQRILRALRRARCR